MANANGNPPASAGGGGVVLAGLALVWLPTLIILISFAGLMQFKLMYGALSSVFQVRRGGMVWRKIQPTLGDIVASLEASVGPAHMFTPSLTHILLVGVILAVLVAGERAKRR
jgi:hypothetical protein